MVQYRHTGFISESGKIILDNELLFSSLRKKFAGRRIELFLREERKDMSKSQLNYYLGGVLKEAYNTELYSHYENPKALHDKVFAPMFLSEYIVIGEKLTSKIKKLNSLSEEEASDLIDKVKAYLATEDDIHVGEANIYKQ